MKRHYPDGRLDGSDEGELRMAVSIKNNRLIIDFGKDLSWIGFAVSDVDNLINLLTEKRKEMK